MALLSIADITNSASHEMLGAGGILVSSRPHLHRDRYPEGKEGLLLVDLRKLSEFPWSADAQTFSIFCVRGTLKESYG